MSKLETITIDTPSGSSALQIGDGNTATIGLGKSGDTITIPAGATITNSGTATGFGDTVVAGTSGFFAHGSGSDQTPSAHSWTSVTVFGTERFDIGNNFASNTFTAPATGKYYLSTSLTFDSVSGNFLKVRINPSGFTNPSDVSSNGTDGLDGNGHKSLGLSYVIDMTSGQTANVQVYTSISSLDIKANNHSYFSGIRIA